QSSSAARTWGKRGREPRGLYCLPWFGLGCSGEGAPWRPASWGGGNGGRRRWELRRRLGAAVEIVEVKGDARAPFIGEIRRRREPWGGGRGAVGRRAPRAPLMAIGAAAAQFAAAQG